MLTTELLCGGISFTYAANTSLTPSDDFISAMKNAKAGDTLFFAEGTYPVPYVESEKNTIELKNSGTESAPIVFYAKGHAKAIIDFQFPELTFLNSSAEAI